MKTVKELASQIVGDGKSKGKYFVTIGYGWFMPIGDTQDMKQAKDPLDSVSILLPTLKDAEKIFDAISLAPTNKITGHTIGQVIIEDKNGTIKEKFLAEVRPGYFRPETW